MSSKINLQTCEYARKSSIFQDNQLICTKNVKFSVLRHFAKRGFGTGNASFFPLPGPGNSSAGFPCKTRDVGQLVLGAAAAAAALFAEKRAGANVKNS